MIKWYFYSVFVFLSISVSAQVNEVNALYQASNQLYVEGKLDSCQVLINETLLKSKKADLIWYRLAALNLMADVYYEKNNFEKAVETHFKVLRLCLHDSLIKQRARALNGLGVLYFEQRQFDLAKQYLKQEIHLREKLKDSVKLANNLINLSSVYRNINQNDSVLYYLNQAGLIAEKKNKASLLANYYNNKGNYYFSVLKSKSDRRFADSSIFYYDKASAIWIKKNDLKNALKPITNLGFVLQYNKQHPLALKQFLRAEKIADSLGLIYEKITIYGNLAEACFNLKEYLKSSNYYKKLIDAKDSVQKIKTREFTVKLDKQYELENKSKTILEQALDLEQKNNSINNQRKQLYLFLLVFIILAVCIVFGIIYANFNKRLNKRIEQAKETFFVNIMHEIKTPLSMIQAPLKALKPKLTDEESLYYLSLAEKNSHRLNQLMSQMLEISKMDSAKYRLNMSTGDVLSFISDLFPNYEKHASDNHIRFYTETSGSSQLALFDKDALEKIITNLLLNAIKYNRANGIVGCSVSLEDQNDDLNLLIDVWDTGIGIPKNEQEKLFSRFFRSQKSSKDVKGIGIGLSLVKDIVTAHSGKIWFTSEEDVGSRFTVEIRLKKSSHSSENSFITNGEDLPLILLIEDDEDILAFLSTFLNSKHLSIIKAQNGLIARAILQNTIPDLIITDLMMPELDGLSFIKELKLNKDLNHIPILVLSAKSNPQSRVDVINAGAQVFLSKPFVPEEVYSIIISQLELINQYKKQIKHAVESKEVDLTVEEKYSSTQPYIQKLFTFIFQHIDNTDLGVEFLADLMATNRSHFQRKVKSLTGYSPSELIKIIRLEKAREYLLAKKGNVTEVAYMVGFSSQSYFTKCFSEYFQKSPSEMLQSHA
jgi:two-component system sensor histidine kinase ChiS